MFIGFKTTVKIEEEMLDHQKKLEKTEENEKY